MNNDFNNWLKEIYDLTILHMSQKDRDIVINRYAKYKVDLANNSEITKITKNKLKTIVYLLFSNIFNNNLDCMLVVKGIILFPEICGNEESITYKKDGFSLLNIGGKGVLISKDYQYLENNLLEYMIKKEEYQLSQL